MKDDLKSLGFDDCFCELLCKTRYLFPKAIGVSYVRYIALLMWYKINYPDEFNDFAKMMINSNVSPSVK